MHGMVLYTVCFVSCKQEPFRRLLEKLLLQS